MDQFEQNPINPQAEPQGQPQEQIPAQQQYAQQQYSQQQYEQQYAQQQYAQQQYEQPQYAQPQYAQPPYGQPVPPAPKKSKYGMISVFVGLLCVIIALVGIIKTTNTSFFEIPVVQMVFQLAEQVDPAEEYDKMLEDLEDEFDNATDEEIEDLEDKSGMTADEVLEIMRTPSLNSYIKIAEVIAAEEDDFDEEIVPILHTVRNVLIGYGAVIILFALLAALLKNRALSIIGLIVSVLFFVALVGFIFFVLYAVAAIVHVILVGKHKKAVRGY